MPSSGWDNVAALGRSLLERGQRRRDMEEELRLRSKLAAEDPIELAKLKLLEETTAANVEAAKARAEASKAKGERDRLGALREQRPLPESRGGYLYQQEPLYAENEDKIVDYRVVRGDRALSPLGDGGADRRHAESMEQRKKLAEAAQEEARRLADQADQRARDLKLAELAAKEAEIKALDDSSLAIKVSGNRRAKPDPFLRSTLLEGIQAARAQLTSTQTRAPTNSASVLGSAEDNAANDAAALDAFDQSAGDPAALPAAPPKTKYELEDHRGPQIIGGGKKANENKADATKKTYEEAYAEALAAVQAAGLKGSAAETEAKAIAKVYVDQFK